MWQCYTFYCPSCTKLCVFSVWCLAEAAGTQCRQGGVHRDGRHLHGFAWRVQRLFHQEPTRCPFGTYLQQCGRSCQVLSYSRVCVLFYVGRLIRKVGGLIPASSSIQKCPWARNWAPNCPWSLQISYLLVMWSVLTMFFVHLSIGLGTTSLKTKYFDGILIYLYSSVYTPLTVMYVL